MTTQSLEDKIDEVLAYFSHQWWQNTKTKQDPDKYDELYAQARAEIIALYEECVPKEIKYITFEDKVTNDQDATYVGGYNTAIKQMKLNLKRKGTK